MSLRSALDFRQPNSLLRTQVPVTDMRLYLDKNGDIPLDEKKSLADQKVVPPH